MFIPDGCHSFCIMMGICLFISALLENHAHICTIHGNITKCSTYFPITMTKLRDGHWNGFFKLSYPYNATYLFQDFTEFVFEKWLTSLKIINTWSQTVNYFTFRHIVVYMLVTTFSILTSQRQWDARGQQNQAYIFYNVLFAIARVITSLINFNFVVCNIK